MRLSTRCCALAALFSALCVLTTNRALATGASEKASAEALYDAGRTLMGEGKFAEACGKFEASERLEEGVGTMLNLADCYEKMGRTASAWAEFREAISAAHNSGSAEREAIASARAKALEAKLSFLTIVASKGASSVVTCDGVQVDAAMLGSALPMDPGMHEVVASAAGRRKWSTNVEVGQNGARVSVAIPILQEESTATPLSQPAPPSAAPGDHRVASPASSHSNQRTLAIVSAGVGAAGLILGGIFGLEAASQWKDAKAHCSPYPYCGSEGLKLSRSATKSATVANIGFVLGALGIAGGAVLWFTAPDEHAVSVGAWPGGVVVRGRI